MELVAQRPDWQRKHNVEAMSQLARTQIWKEGNKRGADKKSKDPAFIEKMARIHREQAKDPGWRKQNKEGQERKKTNPEWQIEHRKRLDKLHKNPIAQKKIAEANRQKRKDPAHIKKHQEAIKAMVQTQEWQEQHKQAMKKMTQNIGWQEAHAKVLEYINTDSKIIEKKIAALEKRNSSPEFWEKVKAGIHQKPSGPERSIINYIKERGLPFRYTGAWSKWIKHPVHGWMNPDFISNDGKTIISVGEFFHIDSEKLTRILGKKDYKVPYKRTIEGIREIYNALGYHVIHIPESKTKNTIWLDRIFSQWLHSN